MFRCCGPPIQPISISFQSACVFNNCVWGRSLELLFPTTLMLRVSFSPARIYILMSFVTSVNRCSGCFMMFCLSDHYHRPQALRAAHLNFALGHGVVRSLSVDGLMRPSLSLSAVLLGDPAHACAHAWPWLGWPRARALSACSSTNLRWSRTMLERPLI